MILRKLFKRTTHNIKRKFSKEISNLTSLNAEVYYRGGNPFILFPIPPTYAIKNFVLHPEMTMNHLVDGLKVEQLELDVKLTDAETKQEIPPEMNVMEFLTSPEPQKVKFTVNEYKNIYLQNASYCPVNKHLNKIDFEEIPTMKWFKKSIENKVSKDQANLLSIFLRTVEKDLNKSLKDNETLTFSETMNLIRNSSRTLSEPKRRFIQELKFKQLDLQENLSNIEKEIQKVESKAEKRILLYLYLLIILSLVQILSFYYCIFEVEWLGWDIMEPITYTIDIIGVAIAMRFYLKYGLNRNFQGILKLHKDRFITRNPALRFRYSKLQDNLKDVQNEMRYVEKSIKFYESRNLIV